MSNKNFFNYIIVYIMSIAILGSMFIVPRTKFSSNADENVYKNERIVDFINGDQLISAQIDLYDFSENHFVLYELAPIGYAIYSVTEEASIFLEGSYESSSPYKEYLDNENYYTGPGNYYSETADGLLTIATNEYINVDSELTRYVIAKENYVKNNVSSFTTFPSTPDPTKTTTSNGMVVIKEYQYFKN